MPHCHDPDDTFTIVHGVDNAVIPYPNSPEIAGVTELATTWWPRLDGETSDLRKDPPHFIGWKPSQLSAC